MLKFAMICFLKLAYEVESFKSSARESNSIMDDGMQDVVKRDADVTGPILTH